MLGSGNQLYVLLQLHWYRKEHFGKLIGAYEKIQNAMLALQYCQNTVEKFSSSEPQSIQNEQRTFAATYSNKMRGDDGEDLEFMVFVIVNAIGPLIHDRRNCFRTIELDVQFPIWVTNASKLEKDVRNSVVANIHFTEQQFAQEKRLVFSTQQQKKIKFLANVKINKTYSIQHT